MWQSPVGERSPAPTSLFLCLYDRGRRHKKAPESKGSLTLRYEILSLLWAMGTLYINTIPCPPWECKQNRKGRVCASSRYQRTAGNVQYPLGHGSSQLLQDPVIGDIAQAHGKSAAQVVLRWHIQMGFCPVPGIKSPPPHGGERGDFRLCPDSRGDGAHGRHQPAYPFLPGDPGVPPAPGHHQVQF